MRRVMMILGAVLGVVGMFLVVRTVLFVGRAVTIEAEVMAVEERRGPPKPRSKTPIHVRYRLPDGVEHLSKTSMPLLQKVEVGDRLQVLVDTADPEVVVLPLLSVLWATPITLCLAGVALLVGSCWVAPVSTKRILPAQSA